MSPGTQKPGAPKPSVLRRFGTLAPGGRTVILSSLHPASRGARSLFPSRVFDPAEVGRALKDGHQSRKIGKFITKGRRRGWPIFTLTLEERASCPRTCLEWARCYGNNMQAAERIVHGPELIAMLENEVAALQQLHPQGFLIRLHVLGDFWSVDYVEFWSGLLTRFAALHVFGFTAHAPDSPIGRAVALVMVDHGWPRFAMRFSGAPHRVQAARVIGPGESDPDAILCPAQTGATDCCATCGLCWQTDRSIAFRSH